MPIYEYKRPDGTTFEVIQKFSDDPLTADPETGVPVERVYTAPAIHFKGSGFHNTDYASSRRAKSGAESDSAGGSDSDSGSSSGSDSGSSAGSSSGSDSGSSSDARSGSGSGSGSDRSNSGSSDSSGSSGSSSSSAGKAAKPRVDT